MTVSKDRIKPLFTILATGETGKVRDEAARAIREIQEEQNDLARDIKLIRDLVARYGGAADGLTPQERSAKVRDAALALAANGQTVLKAQDVVDYMKNSEGIEFDVKRPASLVGTVLNQLAEFERVEMNQFKFKGEKQQ